MPPRPRAYWMRLDLGIHEHPKTIAIALAFNITREAVVGHLTRLWFWALQYATDGDLSGLTASGIAEHSGWRGDADEWADALCEAPVGYDYGWIEEGEDGSYWLHDWEEHQGTFLRRMAQKRDWARKKRKTKTTRKKTTKPRAPKRPLKQWNDLFDQFWSNSPRRGRRKDAAEEWTKLCPSTADDTTDTFNAIMSRLRYRMAHDWRDIEDQRYIPHMSRFLKKEDFVHLSALPDATTPTDAITGNEFGERDGEQSPESKEWYLKMARAAIERDRLVMEEGMEPIPAYKRAIKEQGL